MLTMDDIKYIRRMYEKEGWQFFAGGRNLRESYKPARFEVNGNKIAFLGCNQFGPQSYWATEDKAGAASPNYDDYEEIITGLKNSLIYLLQDHLHIYAKAKNRLKKLPVESKKKNTGYIFPERSVHME